MRKVSSCAEILDEESYFHEIMNQYERISQRGNGNIFITYACHQMLRVLHQYKDVEHANNRILREKYGLLARNTIILLLTLLNKRKVDNSIWYSDLDDSQQELVQQELQALCF